MNVLVIYITKTFIIEESFQLGWYIFPSLTETFPFFFFVLYLFFYIIFIPFVG